ncbi:MAG: carboxymuconolactone decarboxylase family protein [Chitinophagaceae bacterium]|nr:carboxymuconolactone decarboxylase family protein [Chitinophagaceae bacterium]
MTQRIAKELLWKGLFDGMLATERYLKKSTLDEKLLTLMQHRVSQINGCGYCLDMHHKDAIHLGETELRLHTLPAWKEVPYFTDKERAVLAYAEALTLHADADDVVFEGLKPFFDEKEIAELTLAVAQINSWNRINKAFRTVPGEYQVGQFA